MKKVLIIFMSFLLVGCTTNLSSTLTKEEYINIIMEVKDKRPNTYGTGIKFYKPRDFSLLESSMFNYVFVNNNYKYYFNVDINGYYNKSSSNYVEDKEIYYSKRFKYNNIDGFLEIKNGNNSYFYIKMLYNYSYIEVSVKESDIDEAVIGGMVILSSIKYNDQVIESLISSRDLSDIESSYELKKPENSDGKNNILDVYDYDVYNEGN